MLNTLFFFSRYLKIWNFLHDLLNVVHGVGNFCLLCRFHDLLHPTDNLLLKIYSVKLTGVHCHLWNLHLIMNIFPSSLHFLCTDSSDSLSLQTESTVLFFLSLGQWLIEHFQFKSSLHKRAISKPQDQFITGFNTSITST